MDVEDDPVVEPVPDDIVKPEDIDPDSDIVEDCGDIDVRKDVSPDDDTPFPLWEFTSEETVDVGFSVSAPSEVLSPGPQFILSQKGRLLALHC